MGSLNYGNVDFKEFESLAKDVMEKILKKHLDRFGEGKDGGIDLVDDTANPTIIVQCKLYSSSTSAVRQLLNEIKKIKKYTTLKNYYIFTSVSLSPQQVSELRGHFAQWMDSDDHIIYKEKIEDFFNERANKDVLEKHQKLFISLPDWFYEEAIQKISEGNANNMDKLADISLSLTRMIEDVQQKVNAIAEKTNAYQGSIIELEYEAIQLNSPDSQNTLGKYYLKAVGVEKNLQKAIEYFEMACAQGSANATHNLGTLYMVNQDIPRDLQKAVGYLERASSMGHLLATLKLGIIYLGIYDNAYLDIPKAITLFEKVALTEDIQNECVMIAEYLLGNIYQDGIGVDIDYTLSMKWHLRAAEKNFPDSQYHVGMMYHFALGVEMDEKQACRWFEKAALQGNVDAQSQMGYMLAKGLGRKKDLKASKKWYLRAAEQNDILALLNLGIFAYKGLTSLLPNYKDAFKWFMKAAELDEPVAQFYVGLFHEKGYGGVKKNMKIAYEWYSKSAEQGYELSRKKLVSFNQL